MLEGGGIQRKRLPRSPDLALLDPVAFERVGSAILEHVHPNIPDCLRPASGEMDVPVTVDVMQFGRPDVVAHRTASVLAPYIPGRRTPQILESARPTQLDAVVFGYGSGQVIVTIRMQVHPRVSPLLDQRIRKHQIFRAQTDAGQEDSQYRRPAGNQSGGA